MRLFSFATPLTATAFATVLAAAPLAAHAQATAPAAEQKPANEQVIEPQVDRREVKRPRLPSSDIELGAFTGTYATQNFGSSMVAGLRLGYHVTEDFFVEAAYAQTKVSDESFRQILPGGVFAQQKETLKYYNVSVGYNLLPGEVFLGNNKAKASAFYLIGGVGSTSFVQQRVQTVNFGFGMRVFFTDRLALQADLRDHIFSLDLLGKRQSTQNIEMTGGFMFFF